MHPSLRVIFSRLLFAWRDLGHSINFSLFGVLVPLVSVMELTGRGRMGTYVLLASTIPAIIVHIYSLGTAAHLAILENAALQYAAPVTWRVLIWRFIRMCWTGVPGVVIVIAGLIAMGVYYHWMFSALLVMTAASTLLSWICMMRGVSPLPLPLAFLLPLRSLIPWLPGKSSGSLGVFLLLLLAIVFMLPPLALGWSVVPYVDMYLSQPGPEPLIVVLLLHPFAVPFLWFGKGAIEEDAWLLLFISTLLMLPPLIAVVRSILAPMRLSAPTDFWEGR